MTQLSRYDFDAGNLAKCQSHGVPLAEIEHALESDPFVVPDYAHSQNEMRHIAVGRNRSGRPIFVIFTLRTSGNKELVRPISARYMHQKEFRRYEQLWRQEGPDLANR